MLVVVAEDVDLPNAMAMPNHSSDSSPIETPLDEVESQSGRTGPRRRGRRGGRRRTDRPESAWTSGAQLEPYETAPADENAVSQQLRLLTSPKLVKAEWKIDSVETPDPQLTYRPPVSIESLGAKHAQAPVSAATFKKSESPLQAVVATVGSMAILAALYHFGYYEGSQAPTERQHYAAAATLPKSPLLRDPFPVKPEPKVKEEAIVAPAAPVVEPVPPPLAVVPPPAPKPTAVPASLAVASAAPSGLYLQVAALKDSAAARYLELQLKSAGFQTEILNSPDDGLIRVISGPYGQRDEARTVAQKMSALGVQPFLRRF